MTTPKESMRKELITWQQAEKILESVDPATYRWKHNNAARLRGAMRRGKFLGDRSAPVVIAFNGQLTNGRHRLWAQVQEKQDYKYWVLRCSLEAALEYQRLGDAPSPWSLRDELKAHSAQDTAALSSAITYLHRFRSPGHVTSRQAPAADQALAIYEEHPGLSQFIPVTRKAARAFRISHGMCIAVAYITWRMGVDEEVIGKFWHQLAQLGSEEASDLVDAALEVPEDNALWKFRKWLHTSTPKRGQAVRRSENVTWVYLNKTWNAWAENRPMRSLQWKEWEKFPPLSDGKGTLLEAGTAAAAELLGE
jgi:hypothetical protein